MPSDTLPSDSTDSLSERRDYFRIEDRVGLEIRRLAPTGPAEEHAFDDNHLKSLKAEFRRLDQDVKSQLSSLAERDRLLTGLIKSLNGKLDMLARIMAFEQNPLQPEDWRDVTLSEGGLSFISSDSEWHTGDRLAIRLTLPPELFQLQATTRVIGITPATGGHNTLHTEFEHISEGDRQQIARHVMRWQIRQRQKG